MFLALGCVGFLSSPALADPAADPVVNPALAGDDGSQSDVHAGDRDIVVTGERAGQRVESPKATSDLLNTPQTVTVISDQTLRRQNLLTLRDALATVPGITFGAGEGGGGYGDAINLRGYSANNDITQDGVRDGAQYSRTAPFNLQQIEVYNGANSVFNGSGSVGGTINLVSKVPRPEDLTILSVAGGTDNYVRATVDANQRLGELIAVRLNAMFHRNDVPGRDFEYYHRWGVAPAITIGIGGPTSLTLAYVHQRDDNIPVYGVPYFLNQINDGPLPEADDSDYFGYRNLDRQRINVDRVTATFQHDFSAHLSVRNLSRWQQIDQYTRTSSSEGQFCLSGTGLQPVPSSPTSNVGAACPAGLTPGQYRPSGPRGRIRDQSNQLVYNQTDLRWESGRTGGLHNILNVGASFSWEHYAIETAELARNPNGSAFTPLPIDSISNPVAIYTGPINRTVTARSRAESRDSAVYAFDTLEIGPMFEINGGVRLEQASGTFRNQPLAFYPPGTNPLTPADLAPQVSRETLFSYRIGAVFKPTPWSSLYAAFGNARTPSLATVRLGCTTGSGATLVNFCNVAPETARSYEVGAKADLLGRRLQLTAAIFRNERSNFRVPSNEPGVTDPQVVDGRSRVDGIALGASGNITRAWSIFANYTYLHSEVLQSVSDYCLANPSAACLNSAAIPDPQRGDAIIQTPKHAASLFTTYRLPFGLQVGYGFTYQGGFATYQRTLLQRRQYFSHDWLTHRLFLSYEIRDGLTAQLNVTNVTNTRYFTGIRNNVATTANAATRVTVGAITGGWAVPGEGHSAVLSLFYSF